MSRNLRSTRRVALALATFLSLSLPAAPVTAQGRGQEMPRHESPSSERLLHQAWSRLTAPWTALWSALTVTSPLAPADPGEITPTMDGRSTIDPLG